MCISQRVKLLMVQVCIASSWASVTLFIYNSNIWSLLCLKLFPEWQGIKAIQYIWQSVDQYINCFVLTGALKNVGLFVKILGRDQPNP